MPTYKFHTQQHYWIHTWYSKNFIYCTTCLSSMAIKGRNLILLFFLCFVLLRSTCDSKGDTLVQGKQLRDGEYLISANGAFTLGFFSVDASGKRYLGIWYTKYDDKKVWVANRDDPIPDSSGYLTIDDDDGRLIIIHSGGNKDLVSYYTQKASINSTSAILRDDGNLVLRENQNTLDGWGQVLWQSFDHPTDTLLPRPECRSSTPRHFSPKRGYAPNGFRFDDDMSIIDCQAKCWSECPCVAYASTNDVRTGCEIWSKEMQRLFRVEGYYDGQAREIYFLPSNQADDRSWFIDEKRVIEEKNAADEGMPWLINAVGVIVGGSFGLIACSLCYLGWKDLTLKEKKYNRQQELLFELEAITKSLTKYGNANKLEKNGKSSNELQLFSFQSIATATNNFSTENKLGEGGFGPVYKGVLLDKQEIAIKKLSRSSGQGLEEFKNEIVLIGKLQHNNLVRLLGCCIKGEEKILIYEYLPNKSLDFFLFDPIQKNLLDWKKRYNIIEGIAQGLLYLHKYSRLKVVHRDLKASNILLDNEMNPKISDFGMARIFGRNESQANTKRIVGTYGYMSPEYAMEGIFSMKSDVFSFGVLLLEIVSGRKNYSNYYYKRPLNLIGYAWELWKEGRILELMDQTLGDLCPKNVIRRCIHVGLLCVQENPIDRPTISEVLSMLSNESMQLSTPKQPAFFIGRTVQESKIPTSRSENCSLNNVSISVLEAR